MRERERERERELSSEPGHSLLTLPGVNVPNYKNRTLWTADNLDVMRGMNSETVDLIYLDPPFNSKQDYAAPIGSQAAGAAFTDTWSLDDIKTEHAEELQAAAPELWHTVVGAGHTAGDSMQAYLTYMSVRLIEMHRILKTTGSLYLHCDPTASHYLKQLLDAVFGVRNFRNEIVWHYGGRGAKAVAQRFPRNHDVIFYYSKGHTTTYHAVYHEVEMKSGYQIDEDNRAFKTSPRGDYTDQSIKRLDAEGRVHRTRTGNIRIKYFLKRRGDKVYDDKLIGSVWDVPDMMHSPKKERTGYPTQKPLTLLERIIASSSNEGDLVFDPFCGCATTMVAAEKLGRQWVGVDIEPLARDLVVQRLQDNADTMPLFKLNQEGTPELPDIIHTTKPPKRTDPQAEVRSKNIKRVLYQRQNGCCVGKCGDRHFPIDIFEIDHIKPRSKGGADVDSNLQLLCPPCNGSKSNRAMSKWLAGK